MHLGDRRMNKMELRHHSSRQYEWVKIDQPHRAGELVQNCREARPRVDEVQELFRSRLIGICEGIQLKWLDADLDRDLGIESVSGPLNFFVLAARWSVRW